MARTSPGDWLKSILGRPVQVKLHSGEVFKGVLVCLDGYLNVALEQCEEYHADKFIEKHGDAFLRGCNVMYISKVEA